MVWLTSVTCPLMEDFHIPNILGACQRKQWVFGSQITANSVAEAITFSQLSGKIISKLNAAQILIQKLNAVPGTTSAFATSKTVNGFTLMGENTATYSILVLGTEPYSPRATAKWAKDYCPYCKEMKYNAIVGAPLTSQVLFSFSHTLAAAADAVTFRGQTIQTITGLPGGQRTGPLVSLMNDTSYQLILTKTSSTAITNLPYPSALSKGGFTLHGDSGETYDVLIFGTILN